MGLDSLRLLSLTHGTASPPCSQIRGPERPWLCRRPHPQGSGGPALGRAGSGGPALGRAGRRQPGLSPAARWFVPVVSFQLRAETRLLHVPCPLLPLSLASSRMWPLAAACSLRSHSPTSQSASCESADRGSVPDVPLTLRCSGAAEPSRMEVAGAGQASGPRASQWVLEPLQGPEPQGWGICWLSPRMRGPVVGARLFARSEPSVEEGSPAPLGVGKGHRPSSP